MDETELSKIPGRTWKRRQFFRPDKIYLFPDFFRRASKSWLARSSLPLREQKVSPEDLSRSFAKRTDGVDVKPGESDETGKALPKLPDELVERIMSRIPFPFIFKARVLSKSWLARLSSISSQKDEEKRRLAISFQQQMVERSLFWKYFCAKYSSEGEGDGEIVAYDCRCQDVLRTWPSLSFLPHQLLIELLPRLQSELQSEEATEGALLLLRRTRCPYLSKSPPFVLVL